MSTEGGLYERDPEAWNAYLAEGNAKQARKRVSADAIVRDSSGRIILVDPTYKPDWDLARRHGRGQRAARRRGAPGTTRRTRTRHPGRRPALRRLGLTPRPWADLLNFIFDGGTLNDSEIADLQLVDSELRDLSPATKARPKNASGPTSGAGQAPR